MYVCVCVCVCLCVCTQWKSAFIDKYARPYSANQLGERTPDPLAMLAINLAINPSCNRNPSSSSIFPCAIQTKHTHTHTHSHALQLNWWKCCFQLRPNCNYAIQCEWVFVRVLVFGQCQHINYPRKAGQFICQSTRFSDSIVHCTLCKAIVKKGPDSWSSSTQRRGHLRASKQAPEER